MQQLREELLQSADEVNRKVNEIYTRLRQNEWNEQTDEGLLEVDFTEYEDCFLIDPDAFRESLDKEVERLKDELVQARDDSKKMVEQLNSFLKQNHEVVQNFMKLTH